MKQKVENKMDNCPQFLVYDEKMNWMYQLR